MYICTVDISGARPTLIIVLSVHENSLYMYIVYSTLQLTKM